MERFQHIVRFGLQGHGHWEYFQLSNSMSNPEKPVVVHQVGGSVSPLKNPDKGTGKNPGFMTLDLDAETLLPLRRSSHYFDLEEANSEGMPTWVSHAYHDTFNLSDLSPSSIIDLASRIKTDMELASLWEWNSLCYAKERPTSVRQIYYFCQMTTSEDHELNECLESDGETRSALSANQ